MKDGQVNYIDFKGNKGREINNIRLGISSILMQF